MIPRVASCPGNGAAGVPGAVAFGEVTVFLLAVAGLYLSRGDVMST